VSLAALETDQALSEPLRQSHPDPSPRKAA
jgi:hypothetical protein